MYQAITVIRKTMSLCPECGAQTIAAIRNGDATPAALRQHAMIEAQVVESEGRIFMQKYCSTHGEFHDLLASDSDFYRRMEELTAPVISA